MNELLMTSVALFSIITIASLLGRFFSIPVGIYLPFVLWGVAIYLFNIFLSKEHTNSFMQV